MKIRASTIGLGMSILALSPLLVNVLNGAHNQGQVATRTTERVELTAKYLDQVKEDVKNSANWMLPLAVDKGLKVGDTVIKLAPGTLGPRTVKVTALPNSVQVDEVTGDKVLVAPNQVARVDQKTGVVLDVFSNEQVNKAE